MAVCPVDAIDHPLSPRQPKITPLPTYEQAENYLRSVRSIRLFKPEPIPREEMRRLVDIGRYPQTGGNSQGTSYIVLEGREKVVELLELFCKAADEYCPGNTELKMVTDCVRQYRDTGYDSLFRGCTSLIVALGKNEERRRRLNAYFSLTFIALMAPVMGYGTCWAGIFERLACDPLYSTPFEEYLGVPEGRSICGAMMAGIPDVRFNRLVARDDLDISFI